MLNNKLKWTDQVELARRRAFSALGLLKRTFTHWNATLFKTLFSTFVRPHLEYCVSVWNPYLQEDIKKIEAVQRSATKLVPIIRDLTYESRLEYLGMTTLEQRRERGDLLQFYKINCGLNSLDWVRPPTKPCKLQDQGPAKNTRSAESRLTREFAKCRQRENFFLNRLVSNWNSLPPEVVASQNTNTFKNNFDSYKNSFKK